MNKQLKVEDRQAIDVLLERTKQTGFAAGNMSAEKDRIEAARKVLELIGQLPEDAVPVDLVARTMKRIAQSASQGDPALRGDSPRPPRINPSGPMA